MRERNNEASKRCRLKRRMKAESMEQQASQLLLSNKALKQRISKLERLGEVSAMITCVWAATFSWSFITIR